MGGWGSGRGERYDRKQTVDESLVLNMKYIFREGIRPRIGSLSWSARTENAGSIIYVIDERYGLPTLALHYTFNGEDVIQTVPIIGESQPYGGMRYWMLCPLIDRSGLECRARCSKLYAPPGRREFGCRKCYDLSYHSCNSSHKLDFFYKDFLTKFPFIPRKEFYHDMTDQWYYKYFRTRKAAKKWFAKVQTENLNKSRI